MHKLFTTTNNRKGYIILSVVVIIAVLALIMQMFITNVATVLQQADVLQRDYQAKCLVQSGIDRGIDLVRSKDNSTNDIVRSSTTYSKFGTTIYISITLYKNNFVSSGGNETQSQHEYAVITAHTTYQNTTYKATAYIFKRFGKWYIYKWWWN